MNQYPDISFQARVKDLKIIINPQKIRFRFEFETNLEREPVIWCVAYTLLEAKRRLQTCVEKNVTISYKGEHEVGRVLEY